MSRSFSAEPAERKAQNLFIGLVSPSGGGKSYTALELAMGIQSVVGGEIAAIDTENGRLLAYADLFRKPDGSPGFLHIPFEPPWGSLDYVAALEYAASKAKTIIVDGGSNEHEAMLEFQEAEVFRMAGNDYAKAERVKMLAWAKPKAHRRKLIQAVTRLDANIIMCFRAKESSKPGKDANGKSVVIPMGFVPMAAPELTFEMALSALFLPGAKGTPTWNPENMGERVAVKLPKQFEWLRQHEGPLNRAVGRRLAEWAVGAPATKPRDEPKPAFDPAPIVKDAEEAAMQGNDALTAHLKSLPAAHKEALRAHGTELRAVASRADEKRMPPQETKPAGQSETDPASPKYELADAPGITRKFETQADYLKAYELTVTFLYGKGDAAELLRFDSLNRELIVRHDGLPGAVTEIDDRVRVGGGQPQ